MTNLQAGNGTFIHRSENKRENENKIKKNSSDKKWMTEIENQIMYELLTVF